MTLAGGQKASATPLLRLPPLELGAGQAIAKESVATARDTSKRPADDGRWDTAAAAGRERERRGQRRGRRGGQEEE